VTARPAPATDEREGVRLYVTGVVQGVGFRPFVHRLAVRHALDGWVRNQATDVVIALEGAGSAIERFVAALRTDAPPLARIDSITATARPLEGLGAFTIVESSQAAGTRQLVAPDVAICDDCLRELADPDDRRYHYPFITCTNCGPRHSVIESMPYDRERTSMRVFPQCPACRAEYESIADRRYHSETNSCPVCGPRLRWVVPGAAIDERDTERAIAAAADLLRDGGIVAIRGIGGFHLACDATDEAAVARLRERKRRDGKPLAVMVRSLGDARALARISEVEAAVLRRPERPIVILAASEHSPITAAVSNGLDTIGVMLAYAPLQILLLEAVGRPLVMTSGNPSHQPLEAALDEALRSLGTITDGFLTHDREIVARTDDSLVRIAGNDSIVLRRARGFAPLPIALPVATPVPIVAVGPHLKNTLALAERGEAYVSQHIGDLETLETVQHWKATLASLRRFYGIEPRVVVRDLHPEYLSTRLAEELELEREIVVQHHHAHVAAVFAEHRLTTRAIGVSFDGTGYGDDGRIWGAELLVADLLGYERVGQLRYAPLPGGDLAARTPWRSALGYLSLAPEANSAFWASLSAADERQVELARQQCTHGLNAPEASSMGRLFDAAASVLGVCQVNRFEGEAAMRLESLAGSRRAAPLPFPAMLLDGRWQFDPLPLLTALGELRARGEDVAMLASRFHESVAASTAQVVRRVAESRGLGIVALGGGVFQNARLLVALRRRLEGLGLRVLTARQLPPNDGGIAYGQAAVGAAILASEVG
jgi:hydrogenase maturation protein HypF